MNLINLLILASLTTENKYGLQIIKNIKDVTNNNIDLKLPSLYNSIKRLEGYGHIQSYWENSEIGGKRRYCSLTEKGKSYLKVQMKNVTNEDLKSITSLMEQKSELYTNDSINQDSTKFNDTNNNIFSQQTPLAIQPNFLNQCDYSSSDISTNKENKLEDLDASEQLSLLNDLDEQQASEQRIINKNNEFTKKDHILQEETNNQLNPSYNIKDIFGDMCYDPEKSEINNNSTNNATTQTNQTSLIENHNKRFDESTSIIKENQIIDDNFKINVTLKSNNKIDNNSKFTDASQTNSSLESIDNKINNIATKDNSLRKTNFNTNKYLEQTKNNEITNTSLIGCLNDLKSLGISFNLFDSNEFVNKQTKNSTKYYKNKFRLLQSLFSTFIFYILNIIIFISFDIQDLVMLTQKHIYLFISILALLPIIFYVYKSIFYPNLVSDYKKINKKIITILLYVCLFATLTIISISFLTGMTRLNYTYYILYMIFPEILLSLCLLYYWIEKSWVKKQLFFIKNDNL